MRLPPNIEAAIRSIEAEYAARGGQQAGPPRLRRLRAAVEAALAAALVAPQEAAPPAQPHPETPQGEEARSAARLFMAGEISAGRFAELLGLEPGEKHVFKTAVHAFCEASQPPPEALSADERIKLHAELDRVDDKVDVLRWSASRLRDRLTAQTEALRALSQTLREEALLAMREGLPSGAVKGMALEACADRLDAILSASPAPHTERTT